MWGLLRDWERKRISITFYSYGISCIAFTALAFCLTVIWRNKVMSLSLIICILLTAAWGAVTALSVLADHIPIKLIESAETARNGAWMCLVYAIYGHRLKGTNHVLAYRSWVPWYVAGIILVLLHLYALPWLLELFDAPDHLERDLNCIMWIGFCSAILVFTEQIYRLSSPAEQWRMRYLCLALVVIFGYDFLMYAELLIVRDIDLSMWQARGIVVASTAPLIAVTVARSKVHSNNSYTSPNVVFHTFMLSAAGIYLLYMAAVGYVINVRGGNWAGVIQISFLSLSALVFILLVISNRVRKLVRVWLSKYFFSYQYDYRRVWLEFTNSLAVSEEEVPRAVTRAMAALCDSSSGLLWISNDNDWFKLIDAWQIDFPETECKLDKLAAWICDRHWIIDLEERKKKPELYENLEIPKLIEEVPYAWLIVPLFFTEKLQGILLLCRPEVIPEINWEDRDLLKVAGRAAATHLALYQADTELVELRQFEGFNRLSAYVIHDLKNILAQQSLLVFNAKHCREEPEFLDDVIETVDNSVDRMKRLMAQLRSGVRGVKKEIVDIGDILRRVVDDAKDFPRPLLNIPAFECIADADAEQIGNVFGHVIKNAQEATGGNGTVAVLLEGDENNIRVVIEDDGVGMDEGFVKSRLFKPFDTTKGLVGMGIGAYESREYVRSLGGNIIVKSAPGKGSVFTIILPRLKEEKALLRRGVA